MKLTIQPIKEISDLAKKKNIIFHTDAVQAFGNLDIDLELCKNIDLLSISGHKFGAPKGVGALFVRKKTKIVPLIHGGGQEFHKRAGTENVANIVGLCKAAAICSKELMQKQSKLRDLTKYFIDTIKKRIPDVLFNGSATAKVPGIVNITFQSVDGILLQNMLAAAGIYTSLGSACSCKNDLGSRTLLAMYKGLWAAKNSIRFSFDSNISSADIEYIIETLVDKVNFIRKEQR